MERKTADRPEHLLMDEVEAHYAMSFGQDCLWWLKFVPGIDEYDIQVCYAVQYPKDPEFDPPRNEKEWREAKKMEVERDNQRVHSVIIRKFSGASREDAVRNMWSAIFEMAGHY